MLFTCRTAAEGGQAAIGDEAYGDLCVAVAQSGTADLIDVEYQRRAAVVGRVIGAAQASGVRVIASNHEFAGTPARDEIIARLVAMQRLGADICKIATMPHSPADVLTLLDATRVMAWEHADRPLITMAMGALGVVSRMSGETFGSAATFGMAGDPPAPEDSRRRPTRGPDRAPSRAVRMSSHTLRTCTHGPDVHTRPGRLHALQLSLTLTARSPRRVRPRARLRLARPG